MEELVTYPLPGLLTDHLPLNLIHKGDSPVMSGDGLPNPGLFTIQFGASMIFLTLSRNRLDTEELADDA